MDPVSTSFRTVVLLIAGFVIFFSKFYMSEEAFFLRFHLIVIAFVVSMISLIFRVRMLSLILG